MRSEEKDMLKGAIVSADGIVTNDDATLSVDLVKDEALKKEFIGKKAGDTVTFDIRTAFPNDYEIAGIAPKKQKDEVKETQRSALQSQSGKSRGSCPQRTTRNYGIRYTAREPSPRQKSSRQRLPKR